MENHEIPFTFKEIIEALEQARTTVGVIYRPQQSLPIVREGVRFFCDSIGMLFVGLVGAWEAYACVEKDEVAKITSRGINKEIIFSLSMAETLEDAKIAIIQNYKAPIKAQEQVTLPPAPEPPAFPVVKRNDR